MEAQPNKFGVAHLGMVAISVAIIFVALALYVATQGARSVVVPPIPTPPPAEVEVVVTIEFPPTVTPTVAFTPTPWPTPRPTYGAQQDGHLYRIPGVTPTALPPPQYKSCKEMKERLDEKPSATDTFCVALYWWEFPPWF